jgi:hypothetical protein
MQREEKTNEIKKKIAYSKKYLYIKFTKDGTKYNSNFYIL